MKKAKVSVRVRDNNVDRALRLFKKLVLESGHMEEYHNKQYYVKPSRAKKEYKKQLRRQHLINKKNDNWVN
jgi:ribosomal protein S21